MDYTWHSRYKATYKLVFSKYFVYIVLGVFVFINLLVFPDLLNHKDIKIHDMSYLIKPKESTNTSVAVENIQKVDSLDNKMEDKNVTPDITDKQETKAGVEIKNTEVIPSVSQASENSNKDQDKEKNKEDVKFLPDEPKVNADNNNNIDSNVNANDTTLVPAESKEKSNIVDNVDKKVEETQTSHTEEKEKTITPNEVPAAPETNETKDKLIPKDEKTISNQDVEQTPIDSKTNESTPSIVVTNVTAPIEQQGNDKAPDSITPVVMNSSEDLVKEEIRNSGYISILCILLLGVFCAFAVFVFNNHEIIKFIFSKEKNPTNMREILNNGYELLVD